jgi:hypothetical protein
MELVDVRRLARSPGGRAPSYREARGLAPVLVDDLLRPLQGADNLDLARGYAARGLGWVPVRRVPQDGRPADPGFPSRVLLELTSRCNLRCAMCPRNILKRPEMDMSAGLARRVIDELDAGGISGLWLYNIGESMLHPDFRSLLAYAGGKRRLGSLWLSTNAQELLPENLDSVLTSGLTFLNVSVNAATAGTYRRVSPGGDYARVLENLERLRAAKKSRGMEDSPPWLRLQIIDQPLASGEIDAFLSEFGGLGDVLSVNLLEAFSQNVAANVEHARGRPRSGKRCRRLDRGDCFIFSDAEVAFCDTDFNHELSIGSVRDRSVREIWSGEERRRYLALNDSGSLGEIPLCRSCLDYDL